MTESLAVVDERPAEPRAPLGPLPPFPCGAYRHRRDGCVYEVTGLARVEARPSEVVVVVYSRDGTTWTRPLAEFSARFEPLP